MKLKTYIALSVHLWRVPEKHRAPNGSRQFFIVVQAPSKKWVAEHLDTGLSHLNRMGLHVDSDFVKYAPKPLTVYYKVAPPHPEANQWFEYAPKSQS